MLCAYQHKQQWLVVIVCFCRATVKLPKESLSFALLGGVQVNRTVGYSTHKIPFTRSRLTQSCRSTKAVCEIVFTVAMALNE